VYRCDDYPCIDLDEVDAGDRHPSPAVDNDPFVEDAIEHIDKAYASAVDVSSHVTSVRDSGANGDTSSALNPAKTHQPDNGTMTIDHGAPALLAMRWEARHGQYLGALTDRGS
jgi:hypothetical protein